MLDITFAGSEMAIDIDGGKSAKFSDCKWNIVLCCNCDVHQWADDCLVAFDNVLFYLPPILIWIYLHVRIWWSWYILSILHTELFDTHREKHLLAKTNANSGSIVHMVDFHDKELPYQAEVGVLFDQKAYP